VAVPAGRTGVIVGDVMGHGPEAAAVMAQLRAAAHALALLDLEPAELLGHLDQVTTTLGRPMLATCVYAVIDPASQRAAQALTRASPSS
jgi:serine phosphatase RsbU (regulator of sigma subunit)